MTLPSASTKYSHENALLIAAARHLLTTGKRDRIEEMILLSLDWDYILKTSAAHGIAPLLFKTLTDADLGKCVPGNYLETFTKTYLTSLMNNQNLYKTLQPVLESFARHSVPVILLKGAALGLTIYEDTALRPFGDLDVLVPREKVVQCRRLLQELNFILITDNYFPIPDEHNDELGCEWSYFLKDAVVELHWGLMTKLVPFDIDMPRFWKDARQIEVEGIPALVMSPENQLLHLCLHQYKHHWEHLRDLVDICLVIEHAADSLDWQKLVAAARDQGLGRCVYYNLVLSERILGVSIPNDVYFRLLGIQAPRRAGRAMRDLIVANFFQSNLPRRFWQLLMVDGLRNRITLTKDILLRPFPREADIGQQDDDHPAKKSLPAKTAASFKSVFYYRKIAYRFLLNMFGKQNS